MTAGGGGKQANPFMKLNSLFEKSLTKSNQTRQGNTKPVATSTESGELDAVKALLSMKSRSSSMPISLGSHSAVNFIQKHLQNQQRLLNESKAIAQSCLDVNSRASRRKQVFKPANKNTVIAIEEDTDEENMNKSLEYYCQESEPEEGEIVSSSTSKTMQNSMQLKEAKKSKPTFR
jgi:hypothetical protein